jgi:hypothetical protein
LVEFLSNDLGGPAVRGPNPVRVHPHRGRPAVAVTQTASDGAEVNSTRQELGCVEVPQVPQRRGDPERLGELPVRVREVVGMPRPQPDRVGREDERGRTQLESGRTKRCGLGLAEVGQELDRQ